MALSDWMPVTVDYTKSEIRDGYIVSARSVHIATGRLAMWSDFVSAAEDIPAALKAAKAELEAVLETAPGSW